MQVYRLIQLKYYKLIFLVREKNERVTKILNV